MLILEYLSEKSLVVSPVVPTVNAEKNLINYISANDDIIYK